MFWVILCSLAALALLQLRLLPVVLVLHVQGFTKFKRPKRGLVPSSVHDHPVEITLKRYNERIARLVSVISQKHKRSVIRSY